MKLSSKNCLKKISVPLAAVLFLVASPAFAVTVGDAAGNMTGQVTNIATLAKAGIFMAGLFVAGAAAMKFKAHSENAQQVPLKIPLIYSAVAALMIGLPAFVKMGVATIFGDASDIGDATGNTSI